jgi:uroporphyrinogen-III synthase
VRILIVRPAPGNAATAAAIAAMGLEPVVVPLFEIGPLEWDAPPPAEFDAVAMTSANAARHGGAGLARFGHLPVFAVGEATGEAARAAGFSQICAGAGDAGDLGSNLSGRVLHLTGADHRSIPTVAAVTVMPVYETRPLLPSIPLEADVALIHSPRAGARLAELMPDRSAMRIVAISPAAAQACGSGWASVHVAETAREHAMLECVRRLCEASPPD